jgi:hypothetical protein
LTPAPLALLAVGLALEGGSQCPAPSAVSQELAAIVVVRDGQSLSGRALVDREGDLLRVALEARDGAPLASRTLAADGTCEELAVAVAVVLASWLGDAYPEILGTLPEDVSQEPAPAPVAPVPPTLPTPAKPVARPPSARPPANTPAAARRDEPPDPGSSRHFVPSVGLGANVSSAGAVPLGVLQVSWTPAHTGFGAQLAASLSGVQTQPLGSGNARWSRWPVLGGPTFRLTNGPVCSDFSAGGALGWLRLEGDGFTADSSASDLGYAAFLGAKISGGPGMIRPFLSLNALFWLKRATAYLTSPDPRKLDLPALELWIAGGIAVEP